MLCWMHAGILDGTCQDGTINCLAISIFISMLKLMCRKRHKK